MYPNPLIYCTCWDPWNLGPRKLIKTPQPPSKTSSVKLSPLPPAGKKQNYAQPITKPVVSPNNPNTPSLQYDLTFYLDAQEVINVSPGYRLVRNREQISVTLGDEMFDRKKHSESEDMGKVKISRTDIIADLKEQISELTVIIEQMNRDHRSAQKLVSGDCGLLLGPHRELEEAHAAQLSELEKNYKAALKAEKLAAQDKLGKPFRMLFFMVPLSPQQDSIYDEMEDKWSKKKAEWEKDEKLERERILLQQKHKITRKFELESEEERKKINESYTAIFENFSQEKEELLKQHERDTLQLEELRKTKECNVLKQFLLLTQVIEEELYAQALILESLNTTLYQTQMELQREKAAVATLEKTLQIKLTEAEDKLKYTIHHLTEENIHLSIDGKEGDGARGRVWSRRTKEETQDGNRDGA
uniref:Flagellum associated containing coiled-coil domains 1 n=1 Tax=Capra hircus TaxID=9925 RepID=A0A452FL81_CAPHI